MERILENEAMDDAEEACEYDAMDFRAVNGAFADDVVALGLRRGHALDVGTGTARIPILIAGRLPDVRLTALDASEAMLELGRKNVAEAGLEGRIALVSGDARRLPFPDATFDGVFGNGFVHHLPDPTDFFREVARVAKPGAVILIRDLLRPETPEVADELVERYAGDASPRQRQLFRDSLGASLALDELAAMLAAAGLTEAMGGALSQTSDRHWTVARGREVKAD